MGIEERISLFRKIFVLSPHTDDGEIGCGGTISKMIEEGKEVYYVAFSTARTSVSKEFPENILEIEVRQAVRKLGISESHLIVKNYPVRQFPQHRQEILEDLIVLKQEVGPDLIFVPSPHDIHQDHQVIASEGLRAFKKQTVLGYEEPWNNIVFETRSFFQLEKRHVERKIEALKCYRSQFRRPYFDEEFIWSLARTRGTQLEGGYAEAFEVLRWIYS